MNNVKGVAILDSCVWIQRFKEQNSIDGDYWNNLLNSNTVLIPAIVSEEVKDEMFDRFRNRGIPLEWEVPHNQAEADAENSLPINDVTQATMKGDSKLLCYAESIFYRHIARTYKPTYRFYFVTLDIIILLRSIINNGVRFVHVERPKMVNDHTNTETKFVNVFQRGPHDPLNYGDEKFKQLVSNIFSATDRWQEATFTRTIFDTMRLWDANKTKWVAIVDAETLLKTPKKLLKELLTCFQCHLVVPFHSLVLLELLTKFECGDDTGFTKVKTACRCLFDVMKTKTNDVWVVDELILETAKTEAENKGSSNEPNTQITYATFMAKVCHYCKVVCQWAGDNNVEVVVFASQQITEPLKRQYKNAKIGRVF